MIELPFEEEMAENEPNRRILRDFALPGTQGSQTSIARPIVNANNFEIKCDNPKKKKNFYKFSRHYFISLSIISYFSSIY